jgi:hypothetical protein
MTRSVWLLGVLCFPAFPVIAAPALETAQEKAEAILDKAIQAYGGEKKLAQIHAVNFQLSAKRFNPDDAQLCAEVTGKVTHFMDGGGDSNSGDLGHWLINLKAKGSKMALLGESKIGDSRVIGIKATLKDGPELRLYFDRDNCLLLKREERTSGGTSGEDLVEHLFDDYAGDNYKYPAKITILRNGKKIHEAEITEFSPEEDVKQPRSE